MGRRPLPSCYHTLPRKNPEARSARGVMAARDSAEGCRAEGNACMAEQDYVGALKWYAQAIALSPKDAALYSNRSFSFLRLGLSARAVRSYLRALSTLR
jgi:tetratricopeptide (TPR) repeat protein